MSDLEHFFAIENESGHGNTVIVCEHASHDIASMPNGLGLDAEQQTAHIAWDPGALGVARGLSAALDGALIHARASRLIYDLNRPPHAAGAMPERSEIYEIPGNRALSPAERLERTEAHYLPFHAALFALLSRRLAAGRPTALITVHSFTPIYFGVARPVELGIIHDQDDRLARAIAARDTGMMTRLNEPYSARDGVTHTLALHATPLGLSHAMLEIRNDLIATPQAQLDMATRLAPVIRAAVEEVI